MTRKIPKSTNEAIRVPMTAPELHGLV